MPIKHTEATKEKARYYYLNGESFTFIQRSLKEEFGISLAKSTLSSWKKRYQWDQSKARIREEIATQTERKATDSVSRRLKVLDNLEIQFIKKLSLFKGKDVLDIKPDEYIRIIREAERLQDALNAKDLIVKQVSEKLPIAMKDAGLTQKQINAVIRNWIEETKEV
tara:strand:+ start:4371 stop:4868 length:498 start_codon:yes stop_codon:yes gene_type:complete